MRIPISASLILASGVVGCIEPLVSDEVLRSELILPQEAIVDDLLLSDPSARMRIEDNDGLPDRVAKIPLYSAFAEGRPIRFWDFGVVSPTPIPLYLLVEPSDTPEFETPRGGFSPVGHHPPSFDSIPGDLGYSPFWSVVLVPVTDRYEGELLPSFAAVDEAQRVGLVETPIHHHLPARPMRRVARHLRLGARELRRRRRLRPPAHARAQHPKAQPPNHHAMSHLPKTLPASGPRWKTETRRRHSCAPRSPLLAPRSSPCPSKSRWTSPAAGVAQERRGRRCVGGGLRRPSYARPAHRIIP